MVFLFLLQIARDRNMTRYFDSKDLLFVKNEKVKLN